MKDFRAIEANPLDRDEYLEILRQSSQLQELARKGEEELFGFSALQEDLFMAFYKEKPQFRSDADPFRVLVLERVMQDPNYGEIRRLSTYDEFQAAVATVGFSRLVVSSLRSYREMFQRMQENEADRSRGLPRLREWASVWCKGAQKEMGDAAGLLRCCTLEEAELQTMAAPAKFALYEALSSHHQLQQIAEFLGRLRPLVARKRRTLTYYVRTELYSVEQGDDVEHALPSELALLQDPETEDIFFEKFVEKRLLQYALRGQEPLGGGDLEICLDTSGSTQGLCYAWEAALALSLALVALKDRRRVTIHLFNARVCASIDVAETGFSETLLRLSRLNPSGGTRFGPPLELAQRNLLQHGKKGRADVVFITDGEAELWNPQWPSFCEEYRRTLKELGGTTLTIVVDFRTTSQILQFSDDVFSIRTNELKTVTGDKLAEDLITRL